MQYSAGEEKTFVGGLAQTCQSRVLHKVHICRQFVVSVAQGNIINYSHEIIIKIRNNKLSTHPFIDI
jgi:hypothetical protein